MDLQRLAYLVQLSEERNFTRAAQRAHVAQPGFSRQIQKLEAELGVALVDRTTRRVALTDDGEIVVAHARRVFAELDTMTASINRSASILEGRVTLGVSPTTGPVDVPRLLAAFNRDYPNVDLAVREELSVRLTDQLRADDVDLALVSGVGRSHRQRLTLRKIADDPLRLVVHPQHRLAHRTTVRMGELGDEPFIMFRPPSTIRLTVVEACLRAGFTPRSQFETSDPWQAIRLSQAGLGVAFLPQHDIEQRTTGIRHLTVADPSLRYEMHVAWRTARRLSPAASQLLEDITGRSLLAGPG